MGLRFAPREPWRHLCTPLHCVRVPTYTDVAYYVFIH